MRACVRACERSFWWVADSRVYMLQLVALGTSVDNMVHQGTGVYKCTNVSKCVLLPCTDGYKALPVFTHACECVQVGTSVLKCVHVCSHMYSRVCKCVPVCTRVYECILVCPTVCNCVQLCTCVCTSVCTCVQ